jgi:hypothetical protein
MNKKKLLTTAALSALVALSACTRPATGIDDVEEGMTNTGQDVNRGATDDDPSGSGDLDDDTILDVHDGDIDGDGINNEQDPDMDGDGIVNTEDPDMDGDGILNIDDNDIDGDGIINEEDSDLDGDGVENTLDQDMDGDGVVDENDNDIDGDGIVNEEDPDIDGDGIENGADTDIDGDGIDNSADGDMDGDGINNGSDADIDGDGIPNEEDTNTPSTDDTNSGSGIVVSDSQSETVYVSVTAGSDTFVGTESLDFADFRERAADQNADITSTNVESMQISSAAENAAFLQANASVPCQVELSFAYEGANDKVLLTSDAMGSAQALTLGDLLTPISMNNELAIVEANYNQFLAYLQSTTSTNGIFTVRVTTGQAMPQDQDLTFYVNVSVNAILQTK